MVNKLLTSKWKRRWWRGPNPENGWRPDEKYIEYVKDALKDPNCLRSEKTEIMNKAYEFPMQEFLYSEIDLQNENDENYQDESRENYEDSDY